MVPTGSTDSRRWRPPTQGFRSKCALTWGRHTALSPSSQAVSAGARSRRHSLRLTRGPYKPHSLLIPASCIPRPARSLTGPSLPRSSAEVESSPRPLSAAPTLEDTRPTTHMVTTKMQRRGKLNQVLLKVTRLEDKQCARASPQGIPRL